MVTTSTKRSDINQLVPSTGESGMTKVRINVTKK
jgi:hypothetical protein